MWRGCWRLLKLYFAKEGKGICEVLEGWQHRLHSVEMFELAWALLDVAEYIVALLFCRKVKKGRDGKDVFMSYGRL